MRVRGQLWTDSHSPAGYDPTDYWGQQLELAGICWVCWVGWTHEGECGPMAAMWAAIEAVDINTI